MTTTEIKEAVGVIVEALDVLGKAESFGSPYNTKEEVEAARRSLVEHTAMLAGQLLVDIHRMADAAEVLARAAEETITRQTTGGEG